MNDYSNLPINEIKAKLNDYLIKGYNWIEKENTPASPIIYKKNTFENFVDIEAGREIRGLWKTLVDKLYVRKDN